MIDHCNPATDDKGSFDLCFPLWTCKVEKVSGCFIDDFAFFGHFPLYLSLDRGATRGESCWGSIDTKLRLRKRGEKRGRKLSGAQSFGGWERFRKGAHTAYRTVVFVIPCDSFEIVRESVPDVEEAFFTKNKTIVNNEKLHGEIAERPTNEMRTLLTTAHAADRLCHNLFVSPFEPTQLRLSLLLSNKQPLRRLHR